METDTTDLIARARAGDQNAFRDLVQGHSHELQVHCYRILGSLQDAEDALQETLVSAWRSLGEFGQRSSLRTWLYQIATNRCLSMLRADSRRPRSAATLPDPALPEPNGTSDVPPWLEPYPDVLLDGLVDQAPGPEARYESTEAISLAFITAPQLLPPRQRAVLVLRDVLGYRAAEVAQMLDATQESVQSALKRARATVDNHLAESGSNRPARQPDSAAEHQLVARLIDALERSDLEALIGPLVEDVRFSMPPASLEYQGLDMARRVLATVTFMPGRTFRVVPTRANGHPAFAMYMADPHADVYRGLLPARHLDRRRPHRRDHRLPGERAAAVRPASHASGDELTRLAGRADLGLDQCISMFAPCLLGRPGTGRQDAVLTSLRLAGCGTAPHVKVPLSRSLLIRWYGSTGSGLVGDLHRQPIRVLAEPSDAGGAFLEYASARPEAWLPAGHRAAAITSRPG